ncbi:GHMP family kinase ATP-binding protein [Fusobacterium ulcerans]|jgi:D-glycero-alpha-D-manno-heptose-7-phosphate kinase|uniref:GHMP kinase N-terminal domain-containing protein n=1 Tax=Fusobacterium ulcerans 12-1B TaxID=457404 RepID=H1PQ76_9FUSO|nr:kinase [Fusobacterium ulcerans]EHO83551.1 hypothetical protein HMPREF0402_00569 [Fusobacterium ulcerans 12-1B]RGY66168.1 kinase [Fusobacterium ulcerans]
MIIVQTPFRMSFLGGGTDIPQYYEKYGGSVLSTTFNKYCYHTIKWFPPFFPYKNKLTYSKIEEFNLPEEVCHPAVREALKLLKMQNLHITYDADLPAKSGLGTSSSFAVGLLNGLHSLKGEFVDKMTLAKEAIHLERELCQEAGGIQDQLAVSFGGLNKYTFNNTGIDVKPLIISKERKQNLSNNLMLFFTGFTRFSSEIITEQIKNTEKKLQELHEMVSLVNEGEKILTGNGNLNDFGYLLDYTWKLKCSLSNNISSDGIDAIYQRAKKAGAIGGKLLGAGGGGFMLLFVEIDKQEQVKQKLSEFLYIPFEFETSGTKVIYYKP